MFALFSDSEEYERRKRTPFEPTTIKLGQIRATVPKHLFQKSTIQGLYYVFRDLAAAVTLWKMASCIDPICHSLVRTHEFPSFEILIAKWILYVSYWFWQGILGTSLWLIGHEAGHGNLSPHKWLNDFLGYVIHTGLFTPYFAWKITHQTHHKATACLEQEENYVPRTRAECTLPPMATAQSSDYQELFEDAPIFIVFRMLVMQIIGWNYYLWANAMGSPKHPNGTNHFSPFSPLFRPDQRNRIVVSDIGLGVMLLIVFYYINEQGWTNFLKMYFIPFTLTNHWIVMITFLHHSDPTVPYYRSEEWTFIRGGVSTVDRPIMGWIGRVFFHNISHDHTAHHLFSTIPFYNLPEVTKYIKEVLKEEHNYDSTNSFRALYRSFTECRFVENEGNIVFYKNGRGEAQRSLKA